MKEGVFSKYRMLLQRYRQAGYDGTTARKLAWDETYGREIKTVEEGPAQSGTEDGAWEENPETPGEFRIG